MTAKSENAARWLLAKYVPDTSRYEPRNVGVIVVRNGEVRVQFIGQNSPTTADRVQIDGRLARHGVNSLDNLKAWTKHWGKELNRGRTFEDLTKAHRSGASYFLEAGGNVLRGGFEDIDQLTAFLFKQMVSDTDDIKKNTPRERASQIFQDLGIAEKVENDVFLHDHTGVIEARFDYEYKNGSVHFMNLISGSDWDKTLASVQAFQVATARSTKPIALIYSTGPSSSESREQQLALIRQRAGAVIDLDADGSLEKLGHELHVIH